MYIPPAFREADVAELRALMESARLANLVTATAAGLQSTPLPLLLAADEGEHGVLYGHVAKANPQWKETPVGDALAIFMGPDAYVSPSWYATKPLTGKVVPTWNYVTVHATGPVEFFQDPDRLLDVVSRLTDRHEAGRILPWSVGDAPDDFVRSQLRGIVGLRLVIRRLEGKRKMSQNRSQKDRLGVAAGLSDSADHLDRTVAAMIPTVEP